MIWGWITDGGVGTASTVATLISTVITLLGRAWNRPKVDWLLSGWASHASPVPTQNGRQKVIVFAELWNAGDGPAFNVRLSQKIGKSSVGWSTPEELDGTIPWAVKDPAVAQIKPGDKGEYVLRVMVDEWDREEITVRWERPPLWRRRTYRQTLRLAHIARTPRERKTPVRSEQPTDPDGEPAD